MKYHLWTFEYRSHPDHRMVVDGFGFTRCLGMISKFKDRDRALKDISGFFDDYEKPLRNFRYAGLHEIR